MTASSASGPRSASLTDAVVLLSLLPGLVLTGVGIRLPTRTG